MSGRDEGRPQNETVKVRPNPPIIPPPATPVADHDGHTINLGPVTVGAWDEGERPDPRAEAASAKWAKVDALADALDAAWGDFVGDTGCYPDVLKVWGAGANHTVEANFRLGNLVLMALGQLEAEGWVLVHPASVPGDPEAPVVVRADGTVTRLEREA